MNCWLRLRRHDDLMSDLPPAAATSRVFRDAAASARRLPFVDALAQKHLRRWRARVRLTRSDTARTATTASDECVPPCPVAEGAMGLLCTCGNVVKRWKATSDRLIAWDREPGVVHEPDAH